jgi:hypothetical protein
MGCTAPGKVLARLIQAQMTVDREADFPGVFVFLAVIFPPAYWAQSHGAGGFQRLVSAARATISSVHSFPEPLDAGFFKLVYTEQPSNPGKYSKLFRSQLASVHFALTPVFPISSSAYLTCLIRLTEPRIE